MYSFSKKVLFIRPPFESKSDYVPPHMGIASLYAECKKLLDDSVEYCFIDCFLDRLSENEVVQRILELRPDLIAFTVKSMQVQQTLAIIRSVKSEYSPIILCGGSHVNIEPQLFIDGGADYSVIGSGGEALVAIIRHHFYEQSDDTHMSKILQYKNRLFTRPDWGIMEIERYNENIHIDYSRNALPVMASTGCPYQCDFCSSVFTWGKSVKYRDPRDVVDEIVSNQRLYGISDVHFYDDNLMLNRNWLIEFLDIISRKKLSFNWICLSRPEIIYKNRDLLGRMKQGGCQGFEIGFETFEPELYDKMNKKNDPMMFEKAYIEICKHNFALVEVLLMLFYDGETFASLYNTYNKLKLLKREARYFLISSRFFATPFLGTKFHENIEKKGLLLSSDYRYKYAIFLNFVPYSFMESKISGYAIDDQLLCLKLKMLGIDDIIYADEFEDIMCSLAIESFCRIFNSLPYNASVRDFTKNIQDELSYYEGIESLYEFVCRMLEFAIKEGAVYEKDILLQ